MEVRGDVVLLGVLEGLPYGLVAVGLVLAFRASRVLNLAHAQVGVFGAVVLAIMVLRWDAPYWLALPVALATGALVGSLVQVAIVRRLEGVPPAMVLVATLGVAQLLQLAGAVAGGREVAVATFPGPPGLPSFEVGALLLTPASTGLVVLGPAAVVALAWLLRRTTFGLVLRATGADPEAARTLGVPARRYAAAAWGLAGALATLTAVLVLPAGGTTSVEALGPDLLLRALAAGVVGGMSSLPVAFAAGIGIGVMEQVARWNSVDPGVPDAVLLGVVAVALLVRRPPPLRRVDASAWSPFAPFDRLPPAVRAVPLVRWAGRLLVVAALAVAAALPLVLVPVQLLTLTTVACYALVGVSVWIATGLAGELSLGQFALAGIGCGAAAATERALGDAGLGLLAAALAGGGVAAALAVTGVRAGGFGLAVVTLAFALAAERWLLERDWLLGDGAQLQAVGAGPLSTATTAGAYALCVLALVAAVAWARRLGHASFGRRLRAVRDNAPVARALGIDATAHRVRALALAGALAGLAGALLGHVTTVVSAEAFPVSESVDVVVMALLGGLSTVAGPLLGGLWIEGLPALVDLSSAALAASAVGWLAVLLYVPGGLAAALAPAGRGGVRVLLRLARHEAPPVPARGGGAAGAAARPADPGQLVPGLRRAPAAGGAAALAVVGVRRRFGAVTALDDVTLHVGEGEVVAVVGPNGAGKTTLLDVVCGLERPDAGRVLVGGEDLAGLPPHRVAGRGIGRSFQDVALFPTLTVRELVMVGAERRGRRRAGARADEVLARMGLEAHAEHRIRTLSTGTRRLAELACLLALDPRVLVLDEPSAGLAQPEAQALARLLRRIGDLGSVAVLVVEHDLAVVGAVADRVAVLVGGRVVEEGRPAEVLGASVGALYRMPGGATGAPAG